MKSKDFVKSVMKRLFENSGEAAIHVAPLLGTHGTLVEP